MPLLFSASLLCAVLAFPVSPASSDSRSARGMAAADASAGSSDPRRLDLVTSGPVGWCAEWVVGADIDGWEDGEASRWRWYMIGSHR